MAVSKTFDFCMPCRNLRRKQKFSWLCFFLFLGIVSLKSSGTDTVKCKREGREWPRATLRGGSRAGNFSLLKRTWSMASCKELCCGKSDCEVALLVSGGCYAVRCESADACTPQTVKRSKIAPRVFIRSAGTNLKDHEEKRVKITDYDSDRELIREKRFIGCHHYHGHVCNDFLDKKRLLYIEKTPKVIEENLASPFSLLKPRLLDKCRNYALRAICHTFYPYCVHKGKPKPLRLCKEDCEQLANGVCKSDFNVVKQFDYLAKILPNCTDLPSRDSSQTENCIGLKLPGDPSNQQSDEKETPSNLDSDNSEDLKALLAHSSQKPTKSTESTPFTKASKKSESDKTTAKSVNMAAKPSRSPNRTGIPDETQNDESFPEPSSGETNTAIPPVQTTDETVNSTLATEIPIPAPSNTTSTVPTSEQVPSKLSPTLSVVNVTQNETDTNFAQTSYNLSTPSTTPISRLSNQSTITQQQKEITSQKPSLTPSTGGPRPSLQVSAGDNKVLTLPVNTISLYASAWPKDTQENPYSYHWQQISAPEGSHGYMEGQDSRRVILTQLDQPGVYQFNVKVVGSNQEYGVAFINVTVIPAPRVNKPPRADISPKEQAITLPTNEVVLDGSKSSDDDKITQYKWEEVKGPLNDKNKAMSSGVDSSVLQLKSLVPGIYTFKLTVTDSDGESDSTTATVTVNNEKDYPPVARAGNDLVIVLPVNHVTLHGNGSTDDKGIVSYEWSKTPSSPAVGDMQGTSTQTLKVSNMVVGDYTFVLKVTDSGGQTDSSSVTVVVQPEKNAPPMAEAGSDKDLVFPDDSTVLDASASRDDQKIVQYRWEQTSGPAPSEMSGMNEKVVTVKKLQEGHYVFKLTVTDDKGLTGSDTVAVNVKKDVNKPPEANAGPDVMVHLPNRAAELDGSSSSDDHGIVEYEWSRDPKSPAAGDVINSSDRQAVLRLSNLVEGMYKFRLTVADGKGLKGTDDVVLTVKEDENSAHLVELYLDVDITKFTEENKEQLIRKLAVILDVQDEDIIVEHLKEAGSGHSLMVVFYVKDKVAKAKDGYEVASALKDKIENEEGFFEFGMLKVEPYICRNNCSGHGYCDRTTKLCVCESFWMQDVFQVHFGSRESNCDWSILYVTVIIFGIIMGIGGIVWAICFCMGRLRRKKVVVSINPPAVEEISSTEYRRRGRGKRRHRYAVVDDDDDKAESMEMLPKGGKYLSTSFILSDTDDDSDAESTVFEAKKRGMNGTLNGYLRKDT